MFYNPWTERRILNAENLRIRGYDGLNFVLRMILGKKNQVIRQIFIVTLSKANF